MSELGSLSAQYESGRRGSEAVGWDSRGGLSLGKYQIAFKVGTLKKYLDFCRSDYPIIYNTLQPFYSTISNSKASKAGPFAQKWRELAKEGKLEDSEHKFIKDSHFDNAFRNLGADVKIMVASHMAIQQVLWSTAVQHGPSGAGKIFSRSYTSGTSPADFIKNIYSRRARKFGKHTARVQAAVRQRFREEEKKALVMLEED